MRKTLFSLGLFAAIIVFAAIGQAASNQVTMLDYRDFFAQYESSESRLLLLPSGVAVVDPGETLHLVNKNTLEQVSITVLGEGSFLGGNPYRIDTNVNYLHGYGVARSWQSAISPFNWAYLRGNFIPVVTVDGEVVNKMTPGLAIHWRDQSILVEVDTLIWSAYRP